MQEVLTSIDKPYITNNQILRFGLLILKQYKTRHTWIVGQCMDSIANIFINLIMIMTLIMSKKKKKIELSATSLSDTPACKTIYEYSNLDDMFY